MAERMLPWSLPSKLTAACATRDATLSAVERKGQAIEAVEECVESREESISQDSPWPARLQQEDDGMSTLNLPQAESRAPHCALCSTSRE